MNTCESATDGDGEGQGYNDMAIYGNLLITGDQLLRRLNLNFFIPTAQENNLGVDDLISLASPVNDKVAVELIPNHRERQRYIAAIEKFEKTQEDNIGQYNESVNLEEASSAADPITLSNIEKNNLLNLLNKPLSDFELQDEVTNQAPSTSTAIKRRRTRSPEHQPEKLEQDRKEEERLEEENEELSAEERQKQKEKLELEIKVKASIARIKEAVNIYIGKSKDFVNIEKFDVLETLLCDLDGIIVLGKFVNLKCLSDSDRITICAIIVKQLFKNKIYYLDKKEYQKLSEHIVTLFPTETPVTYYEPADIERKTPANGKLYYKLQNYRKGLKTAGLLSVLEEEKKTCTSTKEPTAFDDDGESEKDLEWLQLHLEPWVDVKTRWKKTHELRFREKELKRLSGEEWFKLYSCLKGKRGFELISIDFNICHPNASKLEDVFEGAFTKLLSIQNSNKKKSVHQHIEILEKQINILSEDAKNLNRLVCIPTFVAAKNKVNGKRVTVAESLKYFLYKAEDFTQVKEIQEKLTSEAKKEKRSPYPLVAVIQKDFCHNVDGKYLVFGENLYSFEDLSLLNVMEVAFHFYIALDLPFPPQSRVTWNLLQQGFFKIAKRPIDKIMSNLETILHDCKF